MCLSFRIRKAKACFCSSSSSVHVFGGKKLACIVSRIVRLRRSSFAFSFWSPGLVCNNPGWIHSVIGNLAPTVPVWLLRLLQEATVACRSRAE
jgi:hypothetical protein